MQKAMQQRQAGIVYYNPNSCTVYKKKKINRMIDFKVTNIIAINYYIN